MYNRVLKTNLLDLSKQWSIISITGPRQSGKTTLCKMAFPDYRYVNLEDYSVRNLIQSDIKSFLLEHREGLVIDEAQYLPELFPYLQVVVDELPSARYVLSGSSDFLMMKNISQSLAGRVAVRRLLPLSLAELGAEAASDTDELIWKGFYPAVWGSGKSPIDVYDSYVSTYLNKDVRQILNIKDLGLFQRFVVLCASRIGTEFNALAISDAVGVSYKTIQEWMSILETSYTAFRLQPYFRNIGKRMVKTPKIYFYDTGLAAFLCGIHSSDQLAHHPLRGQLFENMIVGEMLKNRYNQGLANNLFFYRDRGQHEVDVVAEEGAYVYAYEIKSAKRYNPEFRKQLDYLQKTLGDALTKSCVIYDGTDESLSDTSGLLNFRNFF